MIIGKYLFSEYCKYVQIRSNVKCYLVLSFLLIAFLTIHSAEASEGEAAHNRLPTVGIVSSRDDIESLSKADADGLIRFGDENLQSRSAIIPSVPVKPGVVLQKARHGQPYVFTRLTETSAGYRRASKLLSEGPTQAFLPESPEKYKQVIVVSVPPSEYRPIQREAKIVMYMSHALSLADGLITLNCVNNGACRELNPVLGKSPSALKIFGVKGAMGLFSHLMFRRKLHRDPWSARKHAYISMILQGGVTGFTLSQSF